MGPVSISTYLLEGYPMGSTAWNGRYADGYSAWSATPGIWVQQFSQDLPPGTARDVRAEVATPLPHLADRFSQPLTSS